MFLLLALLPATALGASTVSIQTELDLGTELEIQKLLVDGGPEGSTIAVALSGGAFTVSDTGGAVAGTGCTQLGADVTCPAADIAHTEINGGDGADRIIGSPIADLIEGGPGGDEIDSGRGGIDVDPASPTFCRNGADSSACSDSIDAGQGFDTVTYENRQGRIMTDLRPGRSGFDDDGAAEGIGNAERIVGGLAADEIIGGIFGETLNGGPGDAPDVICGALGKDFVEYSDKTEPVSVTLDGILATDPDIVRGGTAGLGARADCRPTIKSQGVDNGLPCTDSTPPGTNGCAEYPARDCTDDDGVEGEGDCVGEDVEGIIGSPGDDVLIGNDTDPLYGDGPRVEPSGQNVIQGGGGNDLLDGGLGPDILEGGDGFDAASYENRTVGVAVSIDGAANDGSAQDFNPETDQADDVGSDIEDLIGGEGDDHLRGDDSDNILLGGGGGDLLQGLGGSDQLDGEGGADTLAGGDGFDLMDGGEGDDFMHGGSGRDMLEGAGGSDTVDYSDATTPVRVTPDGAADDGVAGEGDLVTASVEGAIGGIDDDHLTGNEGSGTFQGGGGNDVMNGGLGADTILGGAGRDTANYSGHPGPVNVNLAVAGGDGMADEGDNVAGDVEDILGSGFADVLAGHGDVNIINGGPGNDRISGAEGDDFLAGDLGNDILNGDVGNDILDGAEGNDTLNGTAGKDTLRGFTGNDVLDGGAGGDTMSGGDGVDIVTYASRSGDVRVDTHGDPDDGERNENDHVRTDVESVTTGSGDDTINISDGATGTATCGGGRDSVIADPSDEIGSGCEESGVRQAGICVPSSTGARLSGNRVSLRITCAFNAKGTLRLESAGRIKTTKRAKARKLVLGSRSLTGKIGKPQTVRMNVSKRAARVIRSRKRLRVQAILRLRRDAAGAAMRTNRTKLTVRTSGK